MCKTKDGNCVHIANRFNENEASGRERAKDRVPLESTA